MTASFRASSRIAAPADELLRRMLDPTE